MVSIARRLRLLRGLLLCLAIALPWYFAAAHRDGAAFVESFFGYHNLQRFTQVVNHHQSPWWFYAPILLLASLPWSAALLLALGRSLIPAPSRIQKGTPAPASLLQFCSCWLLAVLLLFSVSATKLPSYWLPATPAAALLVTSVAGECDRLSRWSIRLGALTSLLIAGLLSFSSRWLTFVDDPELVGLPAALDRLHVIPIAVGLLAVGGLLSLLLLQRSASSAMLAVQTSWLLLVPLLWWPLLRVGDHLRSQPLRAMAGEVIQRRPSEQPLVMLGVIKPSLQFYSRMPVAYEGLSAQAQVNLFDRLQHEDRVRVADRSGRVLVVAPRNLPERRSWRGLLSPLEAQHGRYGLWWLDLRALELRVRGLQRNEGLWPTWQQPRPERF
jgi:4-amino-4-deoxy-L-arabinose transferase-like glycosyltransferase